MDPSRAKSIQREAIDELLARLPAQVGAFADSQYPLPIKTTFLGDREVAATSLRQALLARREADAKDALEAVLLAAELCEAVSDDRDRFFLSDGAVQSYVFTGSKWRAGWALVLGDRGDDDLIDRLLARSFLVFVDRPGVSDTVYIGDRDTAPIYFLQMMVRYGLIWGGIAPGDDHEMGHFLEKDMPGLLFIRRDLSPLKYMVALGLMKLGAPAVVPTSFPFPYGNRIATDSAAEAVEQGSLFPNLRQRYFRDETIRLPDYCNPARVREPMEVAQRLGGGERSFFCLRPACRATDRRVVTLGAEAGDIGILIEVESEGLTPDVAAVVEREALKAINYLEGVRAYEQAGALHLNLGPGATLDSERLGEAVYWGVRMQYPALAGITVYIIRDPQRLAQEAPRVRADKEERRQFIAGMTEENTAEFCACTECRPFSLVHTCIITPERLPMCASRTYASVKAAARFGSPVVPWRRPSEKDLPIRLEFARGELLDAGRGEYEGCNRVYSQLTGGQLSRVYLHSLRGYPHTSCGCFQHLAFWLPQVEGIGIMARGSEAVTPMGETWEMLANRAGGKQQPGITGVSLPYIRSRHFLQGDGGIGNVVWVDSALYNKLAPRFAAGQRVATEKDVRTLADLGRFLGR